MNKIAQINFRLKMKRLFLVTWWHTAALVVAAASTAHFLAQMDPYTPSLAQFFSLSDLLGLIISLVAVGFIILSDNQAKKAIILAERILYLQKTLKEVKVKSLEAAGQMRGLGSELDKIKASVIEVVNIYEGKIRELKTGHTEQLKEVRQENLELLAHWRQEIAKNGKIKDEPGV